VHVRQVVRRRCAASLAIYLARPTRRSSGMRAELDGAPLGCSAKRAQPHPTREPSIGVDNDLTRLCWTRRTLANFASRAGE
jgi:hypothetical protein